MARAVSSTICSGGVNQPVPACRLRQGHAFDADESSRASPASAISSTTPSPPVHKGVVRPADPYDRLMPVMWSCPDPNCPPTAIAPADVPESGEEASAEAEARFTTDEVARLLNVPLGTIHQWHEEGAGPPGYQMHKESHYRRSEVVRWLAEQGVFLATCQSDCGGTYRLGAFTTVEG
jgi:hypothetical protein